LILFSPQNASVDARTETGKAFFGAVDNLCSSEVSAGAWRVDTHLRGCYLRPPFNESPGAFVANTRSAEKANRQAQKHRIRNTHVLSTLRGSMRKFREAAASGDAAKTKVELAAAVRQIAKAASKGVIHKGQAKRRISRLTKAANHPPPAKS
jgi:small subunit ribosomal protein S20